MTRIMRPQVKSLPYPEDIRADRRTIQRGSMNDPFDQDGRLYLNREHTAYLYVEYHNLYYVAPDSAAEKLNS